jgi:hypothetical protein
MTNTMDYYKSTIQHVNPILLQYAGRHALSASRFFSNIMIRISCDFEIRISIFSLALLADSRIFVHQI